MDYRLVTPGAANISSQAQPPWFTQILKTNAAFRIQSVVSVGAPTWDCIVWARASYVLPGKPGMTFWHSPTGRSQRRTTDNIATQHTTISSSGNMDELEGGTGR